MSRLSTDITTTDQALRIELSYLLKHGLIIKDRQISSSLKWTNGSTISFKTCYTDSLKYIELNYTTTYYQTKEKKNFNYRIELEAIPSNLNKGEVLYFVCPQSGKRCRILYKCYGSDIWKSREAYSNRIYYDSQLMPKNIRSFKDMFLEHKILELCRQSKKEHYRGKPTRLRQRIEALEKRMYSVDFDNYLNALIC